MKTGRFSAAERIGLMKIFQISVALALSTFMLPGLAAGCPPAAGCQWQRPSAGRTNTACADSTARTSDHAAPSAA